MNKTVNFTLFWGFMQLICTRVRLIGHIEIEKKLDRTNCSCCA